MPITVRQITDQATADAVAANLPESVRPVLRQVPSTPARAAYTFHENDKPVGCALVMVPTDNKTGRVVIDHLYTASLAHFGPCLSKLAEVLELTHDAVAVLLPPAPAAHVATDDTPPIEEQKMDAARKLGFRCIRIRRECPGQSSSGDRFVYQRPARAAAPEPEEAHV